MKKQRAVPSPECARVGTSDGRSPNLGMNCMSAKCFIDTNILIYAHETATGEKHRRARELLEQVWQEGKGFISNQVLQEFCVSVIRKSKSPCLLRNYPTRCAIC